MTELFAAARALLDAMQARCDAATEGPWESDDTDPSIWGPKVIVLGNYTAADGYDSPAWEDGSPDDRAFIAASRADMPRLIAAVRAGLDLADGWTARGEHLMAYSKTVPEEVGTALLEAGAEFVEKARILRSALTTALETS